jgi:hypothetical protein
MLELKSAAFIKATHNLATLSGGMTPLKLLNPHWKDTDPVGPDGFENAKSQLLLLLDVLPDLEAPTTLAGVQNFLKLLDGSGASFPVGAYCSWLNNINVTFRTEFAAQKFLALSTSEAKRFDCTSSPFGPEVEQKFPGSVSEDIAEASKCIACARYTAGVFHLMRALEVGTAKFADIFAILPIDKRGKDKQWQNFLDEINREIGKLPSHDQKTKNYAEISANLYNVKLAWRNEVMHPKQTYTEEEALEVFAASRAFMRRLASVI